LRLFAVTWSPSSLLHNIRATVEPNATNPFEGISPDDGLNAGENSPHYGRYRLAFAQVSPHCHDSLPCFRAFATIRPDRIADARATYELLPPKMRLVLRFVEADDNLHLEMDLSHGGVIYIALDSVYASISLFAEQLEDVHFFLYSLGDDDDRWLDEYRIRNGQLQFQRHNMSQAVWPGVYYAWIQLTRDRKDESAWEHFLVEQIAHCYSSCGGASNPVCTDLMARLKEVYPDNPLMQQLSAKR
jgi:hypothetical protein